MSKTEEKKADQKEKEEQRKADTAFNDLVRRARERDALIELTEPNQQHD